MVDYSGLENRRTERYRGFESLSLRKTKGNELETNELPFNFAKSVDKIWTVKSSYVEPTFLADLCQTLKNVKKNVRHKF